MDGKGIPYIEREQEKDKANTVYTESTGDVQREGKR